MNFFKPKLTPRKVFLNISTIFGLVMIWRGVWYVLDAIDKAFFGSHVLTSVAGIVIGLVILYLPDKDLKEIEKL